MSMQLHLEVRGVGGAGGKGGQSGGAGGKGGGPDLSPLAHWGGGIGATPHSKPARAGCAIPGVPQDKQFLLAFSDVTQINYDAIRFGELLKLQMDSAMQLKGAYGGYVARSMEIVNSGSDEPPPYPSY
ncbi:hypothetical protein R3P38DRAFT_3170788 [Favolaschia claudopus]|uniref:Uncharacterized protein n=1 Tax=Favolaschia claudopus TaxID=2862362 RepID=A0AAW0DW48_9AGAR